jgi:two-component system sensor histidine kinase UhpB
MTQSADPAQAAKLDRLLALMDEGIRGIRSVTERLRPPLLDDLGLLPALRGLIDDFADRTDIDVRFETPASLPSLVEDAELALFRALQEALSNVARHAQAKSVEVGLVVGAEAVVLSVRDDGEGIAEGAERSGSGLDGMRERVTLLGGVVTVANRSTGGVEVRVSLPIDGASPGSHASASTQAEGHGREVGS